VWNSVTKKFQFGISEETPELAKKKLFDKIGTDAYKWRFDIRKAVEDARDKI
jgi:hypothetical protein